MAQPCPKRSSADYADVTDVFSGNVKRRMNAQLIRFNKIRGISVICGRSFEILRLCFDGSLALQLAPTDQGAAYGNRDGLNHYVVHHLPVTKALQKNPP